MAQYFRIKEICAPATVVRQGNVTPIELGNFIYPEEIDTIVCDSTIVYWDDNTGEHFEWTPGTKPAPVKAPVAPVEQPAAPAEQTIPEANADQ